MFQDAIFILTHTPISLNKSQHFPSVGTSIHFQCTLRRTCCESRPSGAINCKYVEQRQQSKVWCSAMNFYREEERNMSSHAGAPCLVLDGSDIAN